MDKQQTTARTPGRCEAVSQEREPAIHKRAWFYYALARLAVARNLAVAVAIAAMCVGAVGLTLWAVGVKQRADAAAGLSLPVPPVQQPPQPVADPLYSYCQMWPNEPARYMIDPSKHPELYFMVHFTHQCGHQDSFIPAERSLGVNDVAGYKAMLEQTLCPSCRSLANSRARQAKEKQAAGGVTADAAH
jgi:hypothetical protein